MSNIYMRQQDVIRSLFDYLEEKKTIGQCIDDCPKTDMKLIIEQLKSIRTGENASVIDSIIQELGK